VASLVEADVPGGQEDILGTAQYSAPEYFVGEGGTTRSDLFSLGVITYQMLTGKLPYGAEVAKCRTRAAQNKLRYDSVLYDDQEIPAWIDERAPQGRAPRPRQALWRAVGVFVRPAPPWARLSWTRPAPLCWSETPWLSGEGVSLILAVVIVVLLALKSTTG
jgi:serine/threonine protein kinase